MKTVEEKLKYLFGENPHLSDSNTETCIALWEYVATARGREHSWFELKTIMREYPPESITRARRKLTKSTQKQREEEEEYALKYRPDHC
jgi:hypothetical protein